ncbi:MAG: hypothetical protein IPP38_10020 [Bacteroidetes bacterium]|nr:hypothetical protein [Bacteroidota bacterium]
MGRNRFEDGLNLFDTKTKKSTRYQNNPSDKEFIGGKMKSNAGFDRKRQSLDRERRMAEWMFSIRLAHQFAHYKLTMACQTTACSVSDEDQEVFLRIGTLGGGRMLWIVPVEKQSIKIRSVNLESIANNKVWSIFEDNASTLWFKQLPMEFASSTEPSVNSIHTR